MPKIFINGILALLLGSAFAQAAEFRSVVIQIGAKTDEVGERIAQLLALRLSENGGVAARVERESMAHDLATGELLILLGVASEHQRLASVLAAERIVVPTAKNPGPEGFLLKFLEPDQGPLLLAAAVDSRGCLYAVGEILRRVRWQSATVELPKELNLRTAPAFEIRGTQFGQSGVAKRLSQVRDWTDQETQRVILDYALAGANIFSTGPGPMFDFIKSYGLMTQGGFGANTGSHSEHPEWNAFESIGRTGYLCLSVPEAREFMLRQCENQFKNGPTYDLVKFHGGDGGGCECDRCDPYGKKFIHLVEEMAAIIHRYHPTTRVYFTNQKFDDDDDRAIFTYLNEKPRQWLWAWGYGPGSDATTWQPGHRQTHRTDLFQYPGFGPYGLYPQEVLHQLPAQQKLVFYNEITHWKYAQHAYIQMYPRADRNGDLPPPWSHDLYQRRPDQRLTMVYNRLTFFAWPRYYHRVFHDLMRYGVGDITHSSGHHDHFNQWMWQRLLWAPRTTVEEVVDVYCQTWFGHKAAAAMAAAIFQLEENLEELPGEPLEKKAGVERYYELVKQAGAKMPVRQMQNNWLWRMYMQKAALDRVAQRSVQQQIALQTRIEAAIAEAIDTERAGAAIQKSLKWFDQLSESVEMKRLRQEAARLGEESNVLFGVRNDGYFNLQHDFIGLGWLRRQLGRAADAEGHQRHELLQMIVDYENAGAGGRYDNLGTANRSPNVTFGYPYDHGQPYVAEMLSEGNRPSQRSMHFTQDEDQGVTLQYRGLDPEAEYRLRLTLVRPWYQSRYALRMNQKSESIYADGKLLAKEVELPLQMSDFFTFEVPAEATRDGKLEIRLARANDVARGDRVSREQWRNSGGWGTLVSEAWLMKKVR
ncbi:MAG: hypothetical protein ABGX16_24945 [Pirellulales bacterium]